MKQFLVVKTSSLGDVIQAFDVLDLLSGAVDWVVDRRFSSLVEAHPLVRTVFAFDRDRLFSPSFFSRLRAIRYDAVFDLQGNCKSGLFTLLSRSRDKIGFGRKSVREWPNLLTTTRRTEVLPSASTRDAYLKLVSSYLGKEPPFPSPVRLNISSEERERIERILSLPQLQSPFRIMVCLGSNWINKQLTPATALRFLEKVQQETSCSFLFMWGSEQERSQCLSLQEHFPQASAVIDKLPLPTWQNLMTEIDLVLAVDSGALHLCGTTATPSFSIFGPTVAEVFKPRGSHHETFQGRCPYHQTFPKLCPYLRSCPTGACMRTIDPCILFEQLKNFLEQVLKERSASRTTGSNYC